MAHSVIDETSFEGKLNRYGLTAARHVDARPRPSGVLTVDVHSHVFIPEAHALVAPFFSIDQVPLEKHGGEESRAINQRQDRDRAIGFTDPADRVAVLDAQGVDRQVVCCNPVQCYYGIPKQHALAAARAVNDGIARFVGADPGRFIGLGTVPLQDVDAAVPELRRLMRDPGFKGVQILPEVNERELSDPELAPFWAEAERLGAVVMIHPIGFTEGSRFSRHYFTIVIGNPLATTVALHHIIFGGVLERHPGLKILAVHGGGFLPAYSGRIDHAWGARRDARGDLPKPPSSYLRQIYFDTIVFTPHQLEYLVRQYGADHVMMGTDYPADMAEYQPVEHVLSVSGLSAAEQAAILGGTAARLFGIR